MHAHTHIPDIMSGEDCSTFICDTENPCLKKVCVCVCLLGDVLENEREMEGGEGEGE